MSSGSVVPSPTGSGWTEGRVERLKALLAQGLSASQIAQALGATSRNAVIGKIHRLGLAGRRPPSPPGGRAPTPPRARSPRRAPSPAPRPPQPPKGSPAAPAVARPARAAPPVEAVGRYADLAALPRGACRWPIGDPKAPGFSLCGAPAVRSAGRPGPYCAPHRARAHRPLPAPRTGRPARRSA